MPALAWLFIVLAVVVQLALVPMLEKAAEPSEGAGDPIGELMLRLQGRYLVGAAEVTGNGPLLLGQADDAFNLGPVPLRQRFVALAGELGGADAAREKLQELDQLIADEARATSGDPEPFALSPQEQRVQEMLTRLYDADEGVNLAALTEDDRGFLREQLGWFGDLALAPPTASDPETRAPVIEPARRTFALFIGAAVLGGLGLVAGFVGLLVVIVMICMGRLRCGLAPGRAGHGVYAETFALWMYAFFGLQIVAAVAAGLVPDFAMTCVFVAFLMSLLVLVWPVLRGRTWTDVRADIGWTPGRAGIGEGLVGVGCYLMTLPILGVGVVLTFVLIMIDGALSPPGSAFAPTGGPAHPIVGELAAGNPLLVAQILLVASVAAPIVEETMFRGVLYRHLRDGTRGLGFAASVAASTLLNAFVFAVIHPQGWVAIPALMGLAVGFTLAREWRGSLLPSMVMHGLSNGLVLMLLLVLLSQ